MVFSLFLATLATPYLLNITSRNVKSNNKIQWYWCHFFTTLLYDRFFHIIQWYLCHIFITLFSHRKSVIKCDKKVINMWTFFVITFYAIGGSIVLSGFCFIEFWSFSQQQKYANDLKKLSNFIVYLKIRRFEICNAFTLSVLYINFDLISFSSGSRVGVYSIE
jgi:hypothetical protein